MSSNKTLYKVTFDLKLKGKWLASPSINGWTSSNVLTAGDVRDACRLVEKRELRETYEGVHPTAIRVLEVSRVASNVLTD